MTAPDAAGVIHTDLQDGFICADVMSYDSLAKCKTVANVKKAGLMTQAGRDYEVKDGDIIDVKYNVDRSKKKEEKK